MTAEQKKAIARRFLEEVINKGNQALADELVANNFVDNSPLPGLPPTRDGFKQSFVIFRNTFPDPDFCPKGQRYRIFR